MNDNTKTMQALIVEDEPIAQRSLGNLLSENFPEIRISGITDSVKGTVEWLSALEADGVPAPDLIFMDVELSDGNCFQIFDKINVRSNVIMTTAYDSYAVKAFEVNSIDYLLKPIDRNDLRRAVMRAKERIAASEITIQSDLQKIMSVFHAMTAHEESSVPADRTVSGTKHRDKFLIRLNDRIVPVSTRNIAYFYSEAKNSYIVTTDGTSYVLDDSLDTIEHELDPAAFFRISRSCIIAENSIESLSKLLGGRLRLSLKNGLHPYSDLTVSRARAESFMRWLDR